MADRFENELRPVVRREPVSRRQLLAAAGAMICLPVIPRLAMASTVLAVRTWPAADYTRVTLELDSELKANTLPWKTPIAWWSTFPGCA